MKKNWKTKEGILKIQASVQQLTSHGWTICRQQKWLTAIVS